MLSLTRKCALSAALAGTMALTGCDQGVTPEPEDPPAPVLAPGDHEIALSLDGLARRYVVHVPPVATQNRSAATLFAFHGGGGTPDGFQAESGLDTVADREGFVVVYPAGVGPTANILTWNAGPGCCGYARETESEDVVFFERLVEDLAARHTLDQNNMWLTGHSNGAMMAYRIAASRPSMVAGVVGVGGAMQLPTIAPVAAVPVLHIHSEDDPRAYYSGGTRPDNGTVHRPVEDLLQAWRQANSCTNQPNEVALRNGTGDDASHQARLLRWTCSSAPLEHWLLSGAGHSWPGHRTSPLRALIVGPSTEVILAAEEIWRFMSATGQ